MSSPSYTPLRLGILGCANIAKQFARDVSGSQQVAIQAVASRDLTKAQAFAQSFQIAHAYGSYEALLADAALDAIYIPLPNSMHAEWAIRAMEAGKHVLCEKPLALNLGEVTRMFEVARQQGVMLLESYPYWFQPQTRDLLACLSHEKIGEVRSVQASFGFTVGNIGTNIRMKPDLGGGALLDAGSYPLSLIRLVMGCAPERVMAHANWADTGVDISMMATLFYADGRRAQMSCAMDTANHRRATVVGSHGTVETEYLNHTSDSHTHAWGYLPSQLRVRQGIANSIPFEDVHSASGSGFRFAAEAFAQVMRNGDLPAIERAAAASYDVAATLDAIQESAKTGQLVTLRQ
ncbi:gfo/Idh/MocA family oxidoreductase [Limnohabitans sp. TS-CS-82]|uniref:Gfo/Idh/MocA family protein n=1 Tax=Limnohabitans sp. TS-CS-82 TaxID=2094193 RepID=UPI000CF2B83B|nr:Gfo/Idh/MocA family oxidoreductase [Limnohabitans sp. TS-CS-82]PQA84233.1 gfo/Idh/MocA family oxidoreductase [Limnohabitans sp. TS-CS-82]